MVEGLLELQSCVLDAVHPGLGSLPQHLEAFFKRLQILLGFRLELGALLEHFDQRGRVLREHFVEAVTSPLNAVQSFFREHLQGAEWDFVVLLRIFLLSVGFSQVWEHHLNMALWSQSARLNQGGLCSDTSLVDVLACHHVVKCISNNCQVFEKLVREDVRRPTVHLVQSCNNVLFEIRVHVDGSSCSGLCLRHANMLLAEQELPVQVTNLDNIWVGEHDLSSFAVLGGFGSAHTKHGVILE